MNGTPLFWQLMVLAIAVSTFLWLKINRVLREMKALRVICERQTELYLAGRRNTLFARLKRALEKELARRDILFARLEVRKMEDPNRAVFFSNNYVEIKVAINPFLAPYESSQYSVTTKGIQAYFYGSESRLDEFVEEVVEEIFRAKKRNGEI